MSLSRTKGCLFGIAVGDALGAPVEFLSLREIMDNFGQAGITDFAPWQEFSAGSYTDDTQMSLATARGIIKASDAEENDIVRSVYEEYLRWHDTQAEPLEYRAPGNTCLGALGSGKMGTIENPINNNKGCGGVMRIAPVGLVYSGAAAFRISAACAAVTHGHPSGYLSAGFLSELVSHLREGRSLREGIDFCLETLKAYRGSEEVLVKINHAIELANKDISPERAIHSLGGGWTGEKVFGISLYCGLRFERNFRTGVLAAVNHDGDSDSTGSITGAILGARLGIDAIPKDWIERVENSQEILQIAESLFQCCEQLKGGDAG